MLMGVPRIHLHAVHAQFADDDGQFAHTQVLTHVADKVDHVLAILAAVDLLLSLLVDRE